MTRLLIYLINIWQLATKKICSNCIKNWPKLVIFCQTPNEPSRNSHGRLKFYKKAKFRKIWSHCNLTTILTNFFHPLERENSVGHRPTRDGVGDDVNVEMSRDEVNDACNDANVSLDADDDDRVDRRRRRQELLHLWNERRESGFRNRM